MPCATHAATAPTLCNTTSTTQGCPCSGLRYDYAPDVSRWNQCFPFFQLENNIFYKIDFVLGVTLKSLNISPFAFKLMLHTLICPKKNLYAQFPCAGLRFPDISTYGASGVPAS
jgi:hypothetical protein